MELLDKIDLYINEFQIDNSIIGKRVKETTEDYLKRIQQLDNIAKKRAQLMTQLIPRNNTIVK